MPIALRPGERQIQRLLAKIGQNHRLGQLPVHPHPQDLLALISLHFPILPAQVGQEIQFLTEPEQFPVKFPENPVLSLLAQTVVKPGPDESCLIQGVGRFARPLEGCKLILPPLAYGLNEGRIGVTDKIPKRRNFAIFLPHEQEREEGG